ncbi:MAG: hypothetical protein ACHQD9_08890, partial [Chitinophagales bacterium]
IYCVRKFLHGEYSSLFGQLMSVIPAVFFFTNSILAELDARSRFQNYKQLKDHLYLNSYSERLLRTMRKSMCQRQAAIVAAEELGMGTACRSYFRSQSYHWYHIVPDFVFERPQFLLSKYFWLSTFFEPTYHPKVDFSSENIFLPEIS